MIPLSLFDLAFLAMINSDIYDTMESYSDTANLHGLIGGKNWMTPYSDGDGFTGLKASDNIESYSDTVDLDGLNGGSGWSSAYVSR